VTELDMIIVWSVWSGSRNWQMNIVWRKREKRRKRGVKISTIRSSKLSNSINEAFMQFNSPTKTWLRVCGEDEAWVPLNTHGSVMGIHSWRLLRREHSFHLSLSLSMMRRSWENEEQIRWCKEGWIWCVLIEEEMRMWKALAIAATSSKV